MACTADCRNLTECNLLGYLLRSSKAHSCPYIYNQERLLLNTEKTVKIIKIVSHSHSHDPNSVECDQAMEASRLVAPPDCCIWVSEIRESGCSFVIKKNKEK